MIFCCIFLDAFDGIAARVLDAQTKLGKELDSLADLTSFGVAPAYMYFLIMKDQHWIFYAPPLILLIGSTLRLAKFNILPPAQDFKGLATPANAFFLVGIFTAFHYGDNIVAQLITNPIVYFGVAIALAILMLSNFRMFSIKNLHKGIAYNKFQFACLFTFLILLYVKAELAIPVSVTLYIILSLIYNVRIKKIEDQ